MCNVENENNKTKLDLPDTDCQLLQINVANNQIGKTAKQIHSTVM